MALVRNVGNVAEAVGIILEDGTKTFIRIMPTISKGVNLPEGAKLDPHWMALHGQNIRLFDDQTVVQKSKTLTVKSATKEA